MYGTLLANFTVCTHIISVELNQILVNKSSIVTFYAEGTCGVAISRTAALVCHAVINYVTCVIAALARRR